MDYRQLAYFLAVCEHGNMTVAAEAAHVSEQALSKSVRNLERELHTPLFERGNRGMSLTDAGRELQREARSYAAHHEAILARFDAAQSGGNARSLVVAAATGAFAEWLPDGFLSQFALAHPDVAFELRCFSEDSYNRPRHGYGVDLLVCHAPTFSADWDVEVHASHRFRVLMSDQNPLAHKPVLLPADLAGEPLAVAIEQTPGQDESLGILQEAGCVPTVRFGPGEVPFVTDMVIGNRLITAFYDSDARISPGTVARTVEGIDAVWHFFVLKRRDVRLSPIAREFVRAVRENLDY